MWSSPEHSWAHTVVIQTTSVDGMDMSVSFAALWHPWGQGPCFVGLCQSTIQINFWYKWKGIAAYLLNRLVNRLKVTLLGRTFCLQTALILAGALGVSTMCVSAAVRALLVSWEMFEGWSLTHSCGSVLGLALFFLHNRIQGGVSDSHSSPDDLICAGLVP